MEFVESCEHERKSKPKTATKFDLIINLANIFLFFSVLRSKAEAAIDLKKKHRTGRFRDWNIHNNMYIYISIFVLFWPNSNGKRGDLSFSVLNERKRESDVLFQMNVCCLS